MRNVKTGPLDKGQLLRRAEDHMKANEATKVPTDLRADAQKLLQELQIHQIELEMQNEELRSAQKKLEESQSRYKSLYDFSPIGYLTFDRKGSIKAINLTGAALLGLERQQLIKAPFSRFIQPDSINIFLRHIEQVFTTGMRQSCELWLNVKNHCRLHVVMESIEVEYNHYDPVQCHSAIMDITERKQAETKLRRYELLADRHRDVILFIGLDNGRILEANDAATRVYGYSYERLRTLTIHDLRAADAPGMTVDKIAMAFDQGLLFEIVHRRQNGSTFPVEVSVQGAEIDGRRILISVVRDITERRRIEGELSEKTTVLEERTRQMEAANKELESFSYSVSHDLRAPLRAIDGYSRMILRQQGDKFDEDTRSKFNVIRESAQMMGQLIEDLLAFSRLGRAQLSTKKLDMTDLVSDVWNELQVNNPDRRIHFKAANVPAGTADRSLIKQVFINILSNAIKFTRTRDTALIEVGGYENENEIVYYVKDNGVGFDMNYHDKLFGVFQRLHSDTEYEGTGIGLALVKRIINRHGGRVWAEGKVDKGATFYFTLPTRKE